MTLSRPDLAPLPKKPPHQLIPAATLRAIALEAVRRLRDPAAYDPNCLSLNAYGKGVDVWSPDAVIFGELGHLWRAAKTVFEKSGKPKLNTRGRGDPEMLSGNLIDAQVRFLATPRGIDWASDEATTLVNIGVEGGRLELIKILLRVADRLAEGDEMLLEPPFFEPSREDEPSGRRKMVIPPPKFVIASPAARSA